MNADKATEELKVIRALMERPIRYSTMSGLSGILAGLAALAGLAVDWWVWWNFPYSRALVLSGAVWLGVFAAAFLAALICTRVRERRHGLAFWTPVKRRVLEAISAPAVAGFGLSGAIALRMWGDPASDLWAAVAPCWMLFYGVALWQLGAFSPKEVRCLGAAFLAGGLVSAVFLPYDPFASLGATFGGFHIVYGIVVWIRHGG